MPLQVQLLPTSAGDTTGNQPLTTFLLNDSIAIDAGSLGLALSGKQVAKIEHVVLTHAHLDHTASLPVAVDAAYTELKRPMRVYGDPVTLAAVHKHLFNDEVWVDFSKFPLVGTSTPCMEWVPMPPRKPLTLDGLSITPIPVNHVVPTVGLIVQSDSDAVVFTSDTWQTEELWAEAKKLANLRAVFIECSFPDELEELAKRSGHLTPRLVVQETGKLGRRVPVYCVHLKPMMRERVCEQLALHAACGITIAEIGKVYRWG